MTFLPTSAQARPIGLALLCTLLLALWLPAAAVAQSSPDELDVQIAGARATYELQRQALEDQYAQYHEYLEGVSALEAEREAAGPFASDEAVREARRLAREMAVALQRESEALYVLTAEIRQLQGELFEALDRRQASLEQALRSAGADERGVIIAELLAISETRDRHLAPLAALPQVELDEIMLGLEEETMPEELEATAAELGDHERRLAEHLDEVERHILQIELRERDRGFRSEVSLFEEGQNSGRREERSSASASGSQAEGTANGDASSSEPPTGAGNDVQGSTSGEGGGDAPGDQGTLAGAADEGIDSATGGGAPAEPTSDPGAEFDDSGRSGSPDGDGGGFVGAPVDTNDGVVTVPDTGFEPTATPPSLAGIARPIRDPSQDLIWLNTGDDRADPIDQTSGSRLERLRDERDETEQTLEEVREERRRLLERVRALEEAEGF